MNRFVSLLKRYEGLVLILGLLVLLRIPSLTEPAWYGDENIYLTIGQGVRKGLTLYQDITDFPNKPPLIYLLAALVGTVFWFRLLLLAWNGIHAVVVFFLLKELFPKKRWVWQVFTLVFVLLTALPLWEGNIANGEIFMMMPVTAGMLLLFKSRRKKNHLGAMFWAGGLLALGFLFKIPVAFDIAAAGLFFFVMTRDVSVTGFLAFWRDKSLYIFLLGLVLPLALVLGFHGIQGVSPADLFGNAVGSAGYVSVWYQQTGIAAFLSFATLLSRGVLLVVLVGLGFLARKRLSPIILFAGLWLVFSLFGALLSARPYPHYLLQIVPALVVLTAAVAAFRARLGNLAVALLVILLGVGAYLRFGFSSYPVLTYYANFFQFVTGRMATFEYYNRFDGRMSRNYQVAKYLRIHTLDDERIYIWGTEPGIYVLSDRLPVGRLVTSFHVEDLNEYERLGRELKEALPRYIVFMENEPREFRELELLLDSRYTLVRQIDEALIYRLMPELKLAT